MSDRRTPFTVAGEKETLTAFLAYLRNGVVAKVDGLDEGAARRSPVPSGTSLLWLVKHLTFVEVVWFQFGFAGLDVELPSDQVGGDDTVAGALAAYAAAIAASDRVAAAADLDQASARRLVAPEPMTLRWVLVHVLEETARHAGHADIIREQIDGATGR